jgi:hypothetical protein
LAVERADSTGTPTRGAPGIDFAPESKTSAVSPRHAHPEQADDASALVESLLDVTLAPETTVQSVPDVTSSPLVDQKVPIDSHPTSFGFSLDPPSNLALADALVEASPNPLGFRMRSPWDRLTDVSTYGPFHVDLGGPSEGNHLGMPEDGDLPRPVPRVDIPRKLAVVPIQAGGHDPQLEQIREAQARFDEGAGALEPIHRDVGQAWAGQPPAGEIRHLPQGFQHCVADDARVRPPPASSGVGQNLAAAAMLLRAMPEPSTTEGR